MAAAAGLSERIARHVVGFDPATLSDAACHATARAVLDGLGVILAASGLSPEAEPFVAYARAGGPGRASILGRGVTATPALAALANGAMSHALDFEDAYDPAPCHPNASLLPAAFAIVQTTDRTVTGREFLAAVAVGCDLVCRLGLALTREMEAGGWYPPPILGVFGATATAARLMRLDERQTLDAFSLALCQASTPGEIKYSRNTVIRAVREAFPAEAAVRATALAALGVRGFDEPFEGKGGFYRLYADGQFDAARILEGLGQTFCIEQLTFKPWPACRGTHPYIEAAQALRAEHGFGAEQIDTIVATGGEVQVMLADPEERKRSPTVAIDAKFSIPFTVAAALIDDDVTLDSFDDVALADPAKRALAARVRFERRDDWGRDRAASGTLAVTLTDGSTFVRHIDVAAGHFTRPLSDAALEAKFIGCAARAAVPPLDARDLAARIWRLADACDANDALRQISYAT